MSSTGSSGAPTSSPLLLDVESAICTAQHSARDKLSGRRVGKWDGINKGFMMGMACLSTNSLLQACAQKTTKPRSCSFLPVSTLLQGPATGIGGRLGREWQRQPAPVSLLPLHIPGLRPPQPGERGEGGGKWGDGNKLPAAELS